MADKTAATMRKLARKQAEKPKAFDAKVRELRQLVNAYTITPSDGAVRPMTAYLDPLAKIQETVTQIRVLAEETGLLRNLQHNLFKE